MILRMFGGSEPVALRDCSLRTLSAQLRSAERRGRDRGQVGEHDQPPYLQATPRQIERVVAGSRFGVNIVYNLSDPKEMEEDLSLLSKAMKLLQLDYLGGHGSCGNGRVS